MDAKDRRNKFLEKKRRDTPCFYMDGISYQKFEEMALQVSRQFPRIVRCRIRRGAVLCTVSSASGNSRWGFAVDYNDWGHITGVSRIRSGNPDSLLPASFEEQMTGCIRQALWRQNISLPNFSAAVAGNPDLTGDSRLCYSKERSLLQRFFRRYLIHRRPLKIAYSDRELTGEHLYPVFSFLRQNGFEQIRSVPLQDIDGNSSCYLYEVENVRIGSYSRFDAGDTFPPDAPVIITYHGKRKISMPFSRRYFDGWDYAEVAEVLRELGFLHLKAIPRHDLILGVFSAEGTVCDISIGDRTAFHRGDQFYYDVEITVYYPAFP